MYTVYVKKHVSYIYIYICNMYTKWNHFWNITSVNKTWTFAWNFKFCVPRLMAFTMVICKRLLKKRDQSLNPQEKQTVLGNVGSKDINKNIHSNKPQWTKTQRKKHAWFQPESQLIVFAKAFQLSDSVLAAWIMDGLWQPSKVGYSETSKKHQEC